VAGVVIGIIALIAIIGVAVFCIRRRFMNRQSGGGVVKVLKEGKLLMIFVCVTYLICVNYCDKIVQL
jgi:hypothetical protein